ncbi:MAG: sulfotransferase family protein [Natronosporangium sp.]
MAGSTTTADKYRYVFIVTYGRSGSTLLMSLLNTIPGYRINGENNNALYRLYQANAAIDRASREHSGSEHRSARGAWYGMPRVEPRKFRHELVDSFVTYVLCPEPGDRVLGFKEIRYTKSDMPDLSGFLDFLRDAFPDSKIIFNHRDVADTARSSWWARSERSLDKLKVADARLSAVPSDGRHFHFYYDEIEDSLENIRGLFEFLGEAVDEPGVRRVLNTRHSPPPAKYADPPPAPRDSPPAESRPTGQPR